MQPIDMLEKLVGFPTVSSTSNLELVGFVQDYLQSHGVKAQVLLDTTGRKASLFATIGPQTEDGVILSGHSDVVPAGDAWSNDPFRLRQEGTRLIGRGVCDMKGFVATALAMVPQWQTAGLKRPIHIALTRDEEIGCIGAEELVSAMQAAIPRPSAVIVGEPSMMEIIEGHKGSYSFFTKVRGRASHSSRMDIGVSAVMNASAIVGHIADLLDRNMAHPQPGGFVPPYTTLHCGMISGGVAANVVSDSCEFVTDFRINPGDSAEAYLAQIDSFVATRILPRMHAIAPECSVERRPRSNVPPLAPETDGAATRIALQAGARGIGAPVSYATEAGFFQRAGWSVVVCGPGDIAQAHTIGEYLETDQFQASVSFMHRLGEELAQ